MNYGHDHGTGKGKRGGRRGWDVEKFLTNILCTAKYMVYLKAVRKIGR